MTARLARLCRHPVKGIGGEALAEARLTPSGVMPGDREWALLHQGGQRHVDGQPDRWLPKSCFLQGAACAALQAVKGGWLDDSHLRLTHPDRPELTFAPEHEGQRLIDWVAPLWPDDLPQPVRLVRAPVFWTDSRQPWISILSLSSLAELEARMTQPLGTDRWRGNLWIDGWEPLAERDLIGSTIRNGEVELLVVQPITRCAATSADSQTGRLDCDMPRSLREHYGHSDFGIYAQVVTGGVIRQGDEVRI